ncbi:diacylglycerol kinase family protein [Actinotalea sp. K2]|uniref:diacylglycerol/lipid kinase family protein n=1 Tax=Actinotalea sp. K2 TaxID=2939438 RepID=UPI002016FECA|nr:diacylglycerol kinase family protein [Actinotalea sp. K2]MCL3863242.1 diacylglycerol kinase [Actinotalea sp. K2]
MTWIGWLSLLALGLSVTAVVLALINRRTLRERAAGAPPDTVASGTATPSDVAGTSPRTLVAFVANPTKPGVGQLRDTAVQACSARYLPEPLWLETTADDPGIGQTREALERGARVVVAVGGDGTVRAVAEGLAGSQGAMGLIPQGTGNLLARNLDLPINDVDALMRIALTGHERPIDVGWLTVVRDESQVSDDIAEADPHAVAPEKTPPDTAEPARDHIFLVIAGLGFDAAMVADTDEELKAKVGWIAYFVAGVRHLHSRRMRIEMSTDGGEWTSHRLRSLLIGNCGRLPGGITLLPDAVLDDGWLDIGAIDTRGGVAGWAQLLGEVTMQRFGMRNDLPNKIGRIDHSRARRFAVRSRDAQQVQVDGDIIGSALEITARVDERSLRVRVP